MTRRTLLTIVAVPLCLLLIVWASREVRERNCRKRLMQAGFPPTYAESLVPLQLRHAHWQFVPLPVSDLSWNQILDRECTPGWNLVPASRTALHAENARAYDSGAWYQASRAAIAFYMDPRNFFNEADAFMFESLAFNAAVHTRELVEDTLAGSFLAGTRADGGPQSFSDLILGVGRELGVSPVFLAGRLALEQGGGTVQGRGRIGDSLVELASNETGRVGQSVVWGRRFTRDGTNTLAVLAKGAETYNGIYNFFNIGACGRGLFEIRYNAWREAVSDETRARYRGPWDTQERSITGGAMKIRDLYLGTQRQTRYLQKFSVLAEAGRFRWKQYMQNLLAPLAESRRTSRAYDQSGALDFPHRFLIPVYVGLPSAPCPDPRP